MHRLCWKNGKRRYASKIGALRALVRCKRKGRPEEDYYECRHCGSYHLTSQSRATIGLAWDPENGITRVRTER